MPCIPRPMTFDIPHTFSMTSSGGKFIFLRSFIFETKKRIIAFASPLRLQKLFSSPLICLDETFSIVPKSYKRILIIQSIDAKNYEDKLVQGALNDDAYQKYFAGIGSELLLENLKKFAQDSSNRPASTKKKTVDRLIQQDDIIW
ncbi:unnamed protein product [Rotaria sordida]|nr:unnamed protein product [Rotaria sordida]